MIFDTLLDKKVKNSICDLIAILNRGKVKFKKALFIFQIISVN